jgi:hypothetical protein
LASGLNFNVTVLQSGFVGFQGDHARRCHNCAGADVECAIVKVTFDDFAIDGAF